MIDLAKKFSEDLILDFSIKSIKENGHLVEFIPDSSDDFKENLTLKIFVELDSNILNSKESQSIFGICENNISMLINAQCRNTNFNISTNPLPLKMDQNKYTFDFAISNGCVSRDFNLNISIFYSGIKVLSEFNYWPSISLISSSSRNMKTWHFENYNNPIFNIVKNPLTGLRLVTLNLNNIFDNLESDVDDVDYYAVIDTLCIGDNNIPDKFILASIIYEYVEFIVFQQDLAEKLVFESFENNSIGKNMQLFMSAFMTSEFGLSNGFTIENIELLRRDLINFKNLVYKYIKGILI